MKKSIIILALVFSCFMGLNFFSQGAAERTSVRAPVNPAFLAWLDQASKGFRQVVSDDGHRLGYIPAPVDLSHVRGVVDNRVRVASYPATYDLRTMDKLTAIRDQGACGSCWTFGTFASLESFLKPAETCDFAEQDLNATHGFDWAECEGGNAFMSEAYLARWSGPLNETDVPYPHASYEPLKHVQQVIWLPNRASKTDNDTIKYFLTTYGAVYFSFYWSASYYNASTYSYFNPVSTSANHAIAIVGWDDNYDKTKFNTAPAGNGAFICRNSWGTGWGESGYFYMSYYDTSIRELVAFNNAEATDNYEAVYQYDPLGWVWNNNTCYPSSSKTGWGANIFTATANHDLAAVGFITNDSNTNYTIYVYKGVTAGQPTSGTLAATKTGTNAYPGYYTIKLDSPVTLTNGEKFSVVAKFQNPTYGYAVTSEGYYSGYASGATSNPGESFYSCNGTTWTDMDTWGYEDNCNLKAFAGAACVPNGEDDLLGTWSGLGVYYRNSDTGGWVRLGSAASQITAGDLDGDCIDDLIGIWPGQVGVWVKYSKTATWAKLSSSTANWIASGDMNGDGSVEFLGSWNIGVFYLDSVTGWVKLASGATEVAAGDVDGDGTDDLIGIWPSQGGVWIKYSRGFWSRVAPAATWISAGDMNGNGRVDFLGSWTGDGVYFMDTLSMAWTKLANPATEVVAGDIDGDAIDDLIGIWPSPAGIWIKYSKTGTWAKLSSSSATWIAAGKMRAAGGGAIQIAELPSPTGGFIEGPALSGVFSDLSAFGPGGESFAFKEAMNLIPQEGGAPPAVALPGPGEPGFKAVQQGSLLPREELRKEKTRDRKRY